MIFRPQRVIMESDALDYPLGRVLYDRFRAQGLEVAFAPSHNRITVPGRTPPEKFRAAKRTLVVGVRKTLTFQTCKPSAHYQLPLTTGCPGRCEYCYLLGSLPGRPYLRVYVNVPEILARAAAYIEEHRPRVTVFEGSAVSDPVPVERYTGALAAAITFFAGQEHGRLRLVTKFSDVDSLLHLPHARRTTIRFSVNTAAVVGRYEPATPRLEERLQAAARVAGAGYPLGFMIAPVILYEGWRRDYGELLGTIGSHLDRSQPLTFEFVTHRFTERAKRKILELDPGSTLPLDTESRRFKYGQFGYGKYVYPPHMMAEAKEVLLEMVAGMFPRGQVAYFV